MPVVLVLFAIALVITVAGIFLSSGNPLRCAPRVQPVVSRKQRRPVEAPSVAGPGRRVTTIAGEDLVQRPLKARASRSAALRVESVALVRRGGGISRAVAGIAYPDLLERLSSWKVAVPGLVVLFLLSFYLLNMALPRPLLWMPAFFGVGNQPATSSATMPTYAASQKLARLGQLDPGQYRSQQEYTTWAYSACSAAAMTEVINAYGHTYRITDILAAEANIHEITPQDGLLEEVGIQRTGEKFGFKTTWGHNLNVDQVIAAANHGTPVIISFPPATYDGGHILVVRGGNSNTVFLADSSRLDWTQLTRARFLQLWGGFSAIMTPN